MRFSYVPLPLPQWTPVFKAFCADRQRVGLQRVARR